MDYITNSEIEKMQSLRTVIRQLGSQQQQEEIRRASPYSDDITRYIRQYDELRLYGSLELRESFITRPVLIQDIDFDLWISSEKQTNLELMQKGNAPYAFDAPEGQIHLHHIGQNYQAPFAELTLEDHNSNSQLLHFSRETSWRNNKNAEKTFALERTTYWKLRAKKDYIVGEHSFDIPKLRPFKKQQAYLTELRETCEEIFSQCPVEDLDYLSDLAKSYAMMQRVGASSMREFLQNTRDARQTDIQCPACKSSDYTLFGTYKTHCEKIQRYRCKACSKVFTPMKNSLVSGSSFSYRDWIKFIDCLYNGHTVGQAAKACNISEKTAHENRTRLFYALKLLNDKVRLQGNIVLDETYLPVSFKGNHSKNEDFVMPRAANRRGGENHEKGISDNLACIVCAVDDYGNSVAKVAGTGNVSAAKLKYVLSDHMGANVECLYSDKSNAIKSFAASCGYEIKQEKLLRKNGKTAANVSWSRDTFAINRYLQIINGYHSRLKRFLSRFAGISTKYLSGYLYLFAWKERNKDVEPAEAYKELLYIMTEPNNYLSVDEIVKEGHLPDAVKISQLYRKRAVVATNRNLEIYKKYASGQTMPELAKEYGMTKQNVSLIIQSLRKNGYAYKTERDKQREHTRKVTPQGNLTKESLDCLIRDYQIYAAKQQWEGSANEFNQAMAEKYKISISTVKNIVARIKRFLKLKEEIYIFEDVSYCSLEEVYHAVFSDYQKIRIENPELPMNTPIELLAKQSGFTPANIYRIITIMESETSEDYFTKKRKLSTKETYHRDKAIFIDYLRWSGERSDFCRYAAEKYGLSYHYVYAILKYCLYAVPERYNMV